MFRKSSNVYFCLCCDSDFCRTLDITDLASLFENLSLAHDDYSSMSDQLYTPRIAGTPAPKPLRISEIQFEASPRFHYISKALLVPNYFHKFILPTLPEDSQLPLEPLNWEFGVRCNRPFEAIPTNRQTAPPKPPPRPRFRGGAVRAEDAFNEPIFWEMQPPIFDPYNCQTEEKAAGPVKVWFELVEIFLQALGEIGIALVLALWEGLKMVVPFGVLVWKYLAERLSWKTVTSMLIAWHVVKIMPGMEDMAKEVGVGLRQDVNEPLYVLMIPSSRLGKLADFHTMKHSLKARSHAISFVLSGWWETTLDLCMLWRSVHYGVSSGLGSAFVAPFIQNCAKIDVTADGLTLQILEFVNKALQSLNGG